MINLDPLLTAVRLGVQLAARVQNLHLSGLEKDEQEPVTWADYGVQAILGRAIAAAYPDDAVLGEESGEQFAQLVSAEARAQLATLVGQALSETVDEAALIGWINHGRGRDAERIWVIDPIDGTKGFISGRRYAIGVGVLDGGLPVAGIIAAPNYRGDGRGLVFYGQGSAAYLSPLEGSKVYRIAVSQPKRLANLRVVESIEASHSDHDAVLKVLAAAKLANPKLERIDSMQKYGMVACGDADLYLRLPKTANPQHRVWDHLPGAAIVQAAGGVVTDLDGRLHNFANGQVLEGHLGIVASSGGDLHERVLEALQNAWTPPS